jgi:hypothetical protein
VPLPPYHLGPGLAFKAIGGRHFSLISFTLSQVLIDLEPLYWLLMHQPPWHRFWHTLIGASLVGIATLMLARPARWLVARTIAWVDPDERIDERVCWHAAFMGAMLGVYSHIALDSVMHDDVHPLLPLNSTSPLFQIITVDRLETLCLICATFGGLWLAWRLNRDARA